MIQAKTHIHTLQTEFYSYLDTQRFGKSSRFFDELDSTNAEAMRWTQASAEEGALVCAEHQTAGRGRHGRTWHSTSSNNLLFSLVLKPTLPPAQLGLITMCASIALTDTLSSFTSALPIAIKWPNDVLLNSKKCCGTLLESVISSDHDNQVTPVIIGIGVNVNQSRFPDIISDKATSILLETGMLTSRMALLARFLSCFESYYPKIYSSPLTIVENYQIQLAFLDQRVELRIMGSDETTSGIVRGVNEMGAVKLETEKGLLEFHGGEVTCL